MSPPGVWPLEGGPLQLPTSVGSDHPEDWVGHGQYRTQPTTCTNEMNANELSVGGGVLLGCMCVCTTASSVMFAVVAVCVRGEGKRQHKYLYWMLPAFVYNYVCMHTHTCECIMS